MIENTITRSFIAKIIEKKVGFSYAQSYRLVDSVFTTIKEQLAQGQEVKITNFAQFIPHKKNQREGRNPKTGDKYTINERNVILFHPAQPLKKQVQQGIK